MFKTCNCRLFIIIIIFNELFVWSWNMILGCSRYFTFTNLEYVSFSSQRNMF